MSRARVLLTTAAIAASLATPLAVAGAAHAAASSSGIGLSQANDLLAVQPSTDEPGHLVAAGYVGQYSTDRNGVVETDANGSHPVAVPGPTEVGSLALGGDGRTVYAASRDDSIWVFSSDDPGHPRSYPTGNGTCPHDLAVAGDDRVYFTGGCSDSWSMWVLDPADSSVSPVTAGLVTSDGAAKLEIQNVPARPDLLAVMAVGQWVDLLDVSGSAPFDIGAVDPINAYAVAIGPMGTSMYVSTFNSMYRYSVPATAGTPQQIGSSFSVDSWWANGIAVDPTGRYVAISQYGSFTTYGPSSNHLIRTYTPSSAYGVSFRNSVAWVGDRLMTMTNDSFPDEVSLHSHSDATYLPTHLTATTAIRQGTVNHAFTLSGTLTADGHGVASQHLTITRTDGEATKPVTLSTSVTTDSRGAYSYKTTPPNGEGVTYTVSFAGATGYQASTASKYLWVNRTPTYLSITSDKSTYDYGNHATVTAHLGTTYKSRYVRIFETEVGGSKHQIASGYVNHDGKLITSVRVEHNVSFFAEFAGDLRHAPVTASTYRHTRADPELTLRGYYGTDHDGYRLYHKSQYVDFHAHVAPNKSNQCVYFGGEYWQNHAWHSLGFSKCFRLGPASNAEAYYDMPDAGVIGRTYRFGFYYKGDGSNAGYGSLYRYLKVTS